MKPSLTLSPRLPEDVTVNDVLLAEGHTSPGLCQLCWHEAARLYAGGQGAYESQIAAYVAAMEKAGQEASRRAAGVPTSESMSQGTCE